MLPERNGDLMFNIYTGTFKEEFHDELASIMLNHDLDMLLFTVGYGI